MHIYRSTQAHDWEGNKKSTTVFQYHIKLYFFKTIFSPNLLPGVGSFYTLILKNNVKGRKKYGYCKVKKRLEVVASFKNNGEKLPQALKTHINKSKRQEYLILNQANQLTPISNSWQL